MVTSKATEFWPACAAILGQTEPVWRYSQANSSPVINMGIITPGARWNTLKISALAIMARVTPNRGVKPAKMKPLKNISSVIGVHSARAIKVNTAPLPGKTIP